MPASFFFACFHDILLFKRNKQPYTEERPIIVPLKSTREKSLFALSRQHYWGLLMRKGIWLQLQEQNWLKWSGTILNGLWMCFTRDGTYRKIIYFPTCSSVWPWRSFNKSLELHYSELFEKYLVLSFDSLFLYNAVYIAWLQLKQIPRPPPGFACSRSRCPATCTLISF